MASQIYNNKEDTRNGETQSLFNQMRLNQFS